jgi:hypothetical protein
MPKPESRTPDSCAAERIRYGQWLTADRPSLIAAR